MIAKLLTQRLLLLVLILGAVPAISQVTFTKLGTFQAKGGFDESATEIIAFDSLTNRLYSTNGALNRVDIIDLSDPASPMLIDSLELDSIGGGINSVAVNSELGVVVAAVQNHDKQEPGFAVFFDVAGNYITKVEVGALPDMVTFNHAGDQVIVANEGEPNADYSNDPNGSISIITIPAVINDLSQDDVEQLDFYAFNEYKEDLIAEGVRIFGGSQPFDVLDWWSDNGEDEDTVLVDLSSVDVKPSFDLVGSYRAGSFDEGATEIIAYDADNAQLFSTNGEFKRIDVISIANPSNPMLVDSLELDTIGGGANSVAVYGDIVVAAVQGFSKQDTGWAVFYDTDGNYITQIKAGALPDMVTFTPDGKTVIVANEGEPNGDYSIDPEGSITLINLPANIQDLTQNDAVQIDFHAFDAMKAQLKSEGVRIFGGVTGYDVTGWMSDNGDDADTVMVTDATGIMDGMWITLDSDNGDDDVDWVRSYQVDTVVNNMLVLTTQFDFEWDSLTFVEGTDTSAEASEWTVYLMDGSATVSEDLEPEYIAVNATSDTAWVSLQENNAIAVLDIANETVIDIIALGTKDHSLEENGLDASNKDDKINIDNYPLSGMYMPDAIASFSAMGKTYYISANEGDAREYDALIEEIKVKNLPLDTVVFAGEDFQGKKDAGELKSTVLNGDHDGDGDYDEVYSYGARSFSVWDADGNLVWDSGKEFEWVTSLLYPAEFNSTNDETDFDDRSDNKGPEPEAITTGMYKGVPFAFVGLERMGGVMVYNMEDPTSPELVDYVNSRDYDADPEQSLGLAPEDIVYIPWQDSPNGKALMAVSNEVSGTVEVFEISDQNEIMPGKWVTLDSDKSDDDADAVRTYQVSEVDGDTIIFTTAFDFAYDSVTFEEGTDTSAQAEDWTLYYLNGSSEVSQDLEPEYVAVSPDDMTAMVTLQENNALAVVDLTIPAITDVVALGVKDHSQPGNGLDANDKDKEAVIKELPVWGMYMPDAITSFENNGSTFYATANEGDSREYDGLIEELAMGDLMLDNSVFPTDTSLQENDSVGRLKTSIFSGDWNMDGEYEELYSYGSRSFSIWDENGDLIWDSEDQFEQIVASQFPDYFNTTNDATKIDNRSDNKGPEPEAITVGEFDSTTFIFVGLERQGGIMVYQVDDVNQPEFVTYINDRSYDSTAEQQGDMGPEDIKFVSKGPDSALVIVSNEVSGTVSIYAMAGDIVSSTFVTNLVESNELKCYPNPAADAIHIHLPFDGSESYELSMVSIAGRVVKAWTMMGNDQNINVSGLDRGLYIIEASTSETTYQEKILLK